MLGQVLKTIKKYKMCEPGERVLLAVSGGPDSIALLDLFKRLQPSLSLSIFVAHLDHNLRKNSSRDRRFVECFCKQLGLPFFSKVLDWKGSLPDDSIEDKLRRKRYEFLFSTAKKLNIKKIVLGHTLDDQAETVLMRVLRGSGLYGLSAILPVRIEGGFVIIRPLIESKRSQIMCYLSSRKIKYVIDETNKNEKFFRNKIRLSLIPLLEKGYNPNVKEVLSDIALTVGADYEFLSKQADKFIEENIKKQKNGFLIKVDSFLKLDVSLRRIVYRKLILALHGNMRKISYSHIEDLEDLVSERPLNSELFLPHGIVVTRSKKGVFFKKMSCF
ncbi:MAG TPA: tRNA lysidine(34) synthetase TilS [Candidatus Omnitrophota bacterium]|nr:tRNA lysidine(34) synthetase TilS [Candidatus Omnitrophota bacterium]